MLIRLAIVWVLLAGFAAGFAELVSSDGGLRQGRAGSPCDEWSNPDCAGGGSLAGPAQ